MTSDETNSCSMPNGGAKALDVPESPPQLAEVKFERGALLRHQVKADAEELQGRVALVASLHRQRHHGQIRRAVRERTLFRLAMQL